MTLIPLAPVLCQQGTGDSQGQGFCSGHCHPGALTAFLSVEILVTSFRVLFSSGVCKGSFKNGVGRGCGLGVSVM